MNKLRIILSGVLLGPVVLMGFANAQGTQPSPQQPSPAPQPPAQPPPPGQQPYPQQQPYPYWRLGFKRGRRVAYGR